MKKISIILIFIFVMLPFLVFADECDQNKISISSISIEEKSDNVTELGEATASGKNLNLNISMAEVGDNIRYKVEIKNDSDEDYELDKNNIKISSDYIDYSFESTDNSNIIKANSSKMVYLKVKYVSEVPNEAFESGRYNDSKTMVVNLSTENTNILDAVTNPNTTVKTYIFILLVILLISVSVYFILKDKKYGKYLILIISIVAVIPISVYAICKVEIKLDSAVEIVKLKRVCIYVGESGCSPFHYSSYEKEYIDVPINRKVGDFINYQKEKLDSKDPQRPDLIHSRIYDVYFVNKDIDACEQEVDNNYQNGLIDYRGYYNQLAECQRNFTEFYDESNYNEYMNSYLKDESEGCYNFTYGSTC